MSILVCRNNGLSIRLVTAELIRTVGTDKIADTLRYSVEGAADKGTPKTLIKEGRERAQPKETAQQTGAARFHHRCGKRYDESSLCLNT